MTIVRTALGTAQTKTSSTTWTGPSISVSEGETLVIGKGWLHETATVMSISFGSRNMIAVDGSRSFRPGAEIWSEQWRMVAKEDMTETPVVTFSAAVPAKVMICTKLSEILVLDVSNIANMSGENPNTGTAKNTTVPDTGHIAFYVHTSSDLTPQGTPGDGHTLGQQVGTSGGGTFTNIVIQETYEILTALGECRSSISNSVDEGWANNIVAYKNSTALPALDQFGEEIEVGVNVTYQGSESTVTQILREVGIPVVIVALADGRQIFSYLTEIT